MKLLCSSLSVLSCATLLAMSACDRIGARISNYPVLVRASDDLGQPLANVQLSAAGHDLGATEPTGTRLLNLPGTEGERVQFSASCPAGYDGPRERPVLLLKRIQSLESPGIQPIELSLTCDAKEHVSLVAIRTGHAGLPVKLRGQTVALTSTTGTAHVMLREPIGNAFQLTLDTGEQADLRPGSPTRMFTIAQRDGYTVWDQPFEMAPKPPPPPKKRVKHKPAAPAPPPPPPKHIPERLR
jgi:hypothetical protein